MPFGQKVWCLAQVTLPIPVAERPLDFFLNMLNSAAKPTQWFAWWNNVSKLDQDISKYTYFFLMRLHYRRANVEVVETSDVDVEQPQGSVGWVHIICMKFLELTYSVTAIRPPVVGLTINPPMQKTSLTRKRRLTMRSTPAIPKSRRSWTLLCWCVQSIHRTGPLWFSTYPCRLMQSGTVLTTAQS